MDGRFMVNVSRPLYYVVADSVELAEPRPSSEPVHLLSAQILNVPKGIVVDRIGAVSERNSAVTDISADPDYMTFALPINAVTLSHSCLAHDPLCTGWFLEAEVHMTARAPRAWKAGPTRVTYQVGDKTYWQDYPLFIDATTGGPETEPKL
jgi:hypothetical protein